MRKKIIIVLLVLIALLAGRLIFTSIYNSSYVEKYIKKNYKDYSIVSKDYEYLDHFWSTYYDIDKDSLNKDIICNTTLKNEKTGMYVTIPFYHPIRWMYRDSQYGRKNMKEKVKEYTSYWNKLNEVKDTYNLEMKVSTARLTEASNLDVSDLLIYINSDNLSDTTINEILESIKNVETNLKIYELDVILANSKTYKALDPYINNNYRSMNIEFKNERSASDMTVFHKIESRNDWLVDYFVLKI